LNSVIDGLVNYINYANIKFNSKKCKLLIHNPNKRFIATNKLSDSEGNLSDIEECNIKVIVKYLGVHLRTRKLSKMKFSQDRLENDQNV
jgi:hypothetical protein